MLHLIFFLVFSAFYCFFLIFGIKSFIINKIRNILIYNDETFTNRAKLIRSDWDSLLRGKFIKKYPLLFSFIKTKNLILIICMPAIIGISAILKFGIVPAFTYADGLHNTKILAVAVVICYAFAFIVFTIHAILLKKYKIKADLQKALDETKELALK